VKPHKGRRPLPITRAPIVLMGQPDYFEHIVLNLLRDVELIMGY
jgi:hypothetical protein